MLLNKLMIFTGPISVLFNLLLIFVIIKFQKLRKDSTNLIFLHINILQAVFFIVLPLCFQLGQDSSDATTMCLLTELIADVGSGIGILFLIFIFDSFFKIYHEGVYQKFIRCYKYIFALIYVAIFGVLAGVSRPCLNHEWVVNTISFYVAIAMMFLVIFVLIIINIIHVFRKRKLTNYNSSNIGLAIPNIAALSVSPVLLLSIISFATSLELELEIYILAVFMYILPFLTPIFNFIYVYFYDNSYKVCLRQVFKCQCTNDDLDQPVAYHNV